MQAQVEKTVLEPNVKSGLDHTINHGRVEWMDEGDLKAVANRKYLWELGVRLWLLQGAKPCGRATCEVKGMSTQQM